MRTRTPWVLWGVVIVLLAVTITLTFVNGSEPSDRVFIPLAAVMVLGYSTVGALLASRQRRNAIGWLLMTIGLAFVLGGFTDEYAVYTFEKNPGSLPFGLAMAVLSTLVWLPMMGSIVLLILLFPTGRVPGRRWRFLPPAIVALSALFVAGRLLTPEPLDAGTTAPIANPTAVPALENVAGAAMGIAAIGVLIAALPALAALVLRYRRSRGEERQQIRWLAYVAGTTAAVILLAIAIAQIAGGAFWDFWLSDLLFFTTLALIGIGIPASMAVAVLKYHLYDLDLVVRKTVLYVTVAVMLTAVFLVVAVVIGRIAGRTEAGAVVAAAAIGLSFWPVVRLARRVADRIVYGGRATPYEVLAEFSTRLGGSYGPEDVLPRMAQILRDALGADRAMVWLRVEEELRPAAVSPAGEAPIAIRLAGEMLPALPADAAVEVRDRGELLGALTVSMPPSDPMNPTKERLMRDLAAQAGLVLRNVRLIEELRDSRRRIVAAQDERARRLERDIHDGAQQQLVALSVKLRLAEQLAGVDAGKVKEILAQLQDDAAEALQNLRDLARGIYPPLLADRGLAAALDGQARKLPVPVHVHADGTGRYPQDVEAAVYFCCLEALQNVVKYAEATAIRVRLGESNGYLTFAVEDDGIGFDSATPRGSGLRNMRDRVEALGGEVAIHSEPGRGTRISGRVPARGPRAGSPA